MLREYIQNSDYFKKLNSSKVIKGASFSEKALIVSYTKDKFIYVCSDFVSANKIKRQLEGLKIRTEIVVAGYEPNVDNGDNIYPLISSLNKIRSDELDGILILSNVILTKVPNSIFDTFTLEINKQYGTNDIITKLTELGYERVSMVSSQGEFAVRGDILDIFLTDSKDPYRLEFEYDKLTEIKTFNLISMEKIKNFNQINVNSVSFNDSIGGRCILDFADKIFIDEPKKIFQDASIYYDSYNEEAKKYLVDLNTIKNYNYTSFDTFALDGEEVHTLNSKNYIFDYKQLVKDLKLYRDYVVILSCQDEFSKNRLERFLSENDISFKQLSENLEPNIYVISEYIPYSASFNDARLIIIGCDDLFKRNIISVTKKAKAVYLPKIGDYVVHSFHGIGKCIKIERLKISDYEKDYFIIEYKNGGMIYLPSEQASLITAYVGEAEPRLNSLGGKEFASIKKRVKDSLKDMALELAKVYKAREELKGFKYAKDGYLESEFDKAFDYELTQDQALAIKDVKTDMESGKVMERLICGDVGFGKTEVALRASFKAICNGKQVAFLCPTTILSEQHFKTSKERMKNFMVRIEVLNRFKTKDEVKSILNRLEKGEVDLIIGTHRLLSSDVIFKDLGLLVLDEEQRFGVASKEKIKKLKQNIDVITMSATPIPRTLHMSLSGIRDISLIETPPKARLPIQTYVTEYSDELLSDCIRREMARGGQTLIVFNRVEFIYDFSSKVRELVPSARVGVAHGQMQERELESVIDKLYTNQYDVLISTTLIENGIDLPLANTLFVVDADRLGLSALYQLRGRIGRSDRLAYAYLTYNKNKALTEEAYKRLEAIEEFKELGSGFKIAMRDLEIRGAGNILGREQHGHMDKVGYDMYVKLLDETLKELEGKSLEILRDVKMEVAVSAYVSDEYIEDEEERIKIYTTISQIKAREEMNKILDMLTDTFGNPPKEEVTLMKIAYLRNMAAHFEINKIVINSGEFSIYLNKIKEIVEKELSEVMKEQEASLKLKELPIITFDNIDVTVKNKLDRAIIFFEKAIKLKNA